MADEDSWLYGEEGGGEENDEGEGFKEGDAGQDEPMGEEPQAETAEAGDDEPMQVPGFVTKLDIPGIFIFSRTREVIKSPWRRQQTPHCACPCPCPEPRHVPWLSCPGWPSCPCPSSA